MLINKYMICGEFLRRNVVSATAFTVASSLCKCIRSKRRIVRINVYF